MADFPAPVRIARIVTRFGVGGVERHVSTLTANLNRDWIRSWLICGRLEKNESACPEFAREAGVEPIFIDNLRRNLGLWDIGASVRLRKVLALIQPHIVETHQSKAGALGRCMALLDFRSKAHRPLLIHTFHGHQFEGYFNSRASRLFIAIERWLAHVTDLILTVTPTIRTQLIDKYEIADASKVRVVPLGFDFSWISGISRERGWLRRRLGINDTTVVFGTVCRLVPIKNTELLIKSFARMLREYRIDARLVVFGDGELRRRLESLTLELLIDDHVLFAGSLTDRAKIYSDLDVTCLSSHNEGSPLCLIESIAAGVPVVATKVGGVADVATSELDGELVEPGNEEAYAAALARAAEVRARIPEERSQVCRDYYSVARLINNMENIYLELLDRKARKERWFKSPPLSRSQVHNDRAEL